MNIDLHFIYTIEVIKFLKYNFIFIGAGDQAEDNSEVSDAMKNYEFDGKHYVYTDKTSNVTYKFIHEKNEWVVKDEKESDNDASETEKSKEKSEPMQPGPQGVYGFENDTHTYTDPSDGTSYFWDKEKNAWFPKVCSLLLKFMSYCAKKLMN